MKIITCELRNEHSLVTIEAPKGKTGNVRFHMIKKKKNNG